ncbi:MAG: hypothetical protein AB7P03_17125 [Kofleriaceae bacterium]
MNRWLFSARTDLAVFGGSAATALGLLALAPIIAPGDALPEWSWLACILLIDVAHVWSTAFVVYLDPGEWRRRPALYAGVPIACFVGGVALYAIGEAAFWRVIAYLAVFHFIRQQYGWVMMYRARNSEHDRWGRWLDGAVIYAATLYPVIWWHLHLPREFAWMSDGDFITGLPATIGSFALVAYLLLLVAWLVRAAMRVVRRQSISWGKHLVIATTVACWYLGIVATNNDYAFTVTNVVIHGVPYMALVFAYARAASLEAASRGGVAARVVSRRRGIVVFVATLWLIAYVEELLWDRGVWHDRSWLFGSGDDLGIGVAILAPLLAVPQLTHYILDGFLWRRQSNPRLPRLLR